MSGFKTYCLFLLIVAFAWQCNLHAQLPDTTYTTYSAFKKHSKKYPNIKIAKATIDSNLIAFEDVIYKTYNAKNPIKLKLDLYRPNNNAVLPAVLLIHGGGWSSGNKSMEKPLAIALAQNAYVAIPVAYRYSWQATYPAAIHDIKAAIRWIKANAHKYNIDTTRIAIAGNSAGGQMAMLVATTNNISHFEPNKKSHEPSSVVHAIINIDGVVNFLAPASLNLVRTPASADVKWLGATFEQNPQRWKEASPAYWINKNTPPLLYIASDVPRFHAGRDEAFDMLRQFGVHYESVYFPDSPHSFWLFEPWFTKTKASILKFLDNQFK